MKLNLVKNTEFLSPSLLAFIPESVKIEQFSNSLRNFFKNVSENAREENLKTHFMDLLKSIYLPDHIVEQYDSVDFIIRSGDRKSKPSVLFETKRSEHASGMIRHDDINRQAFHELVLYYMRERSKGNSDIRRLMVNSENSVFIFDSSEFDRHFYGNPGFRKDFEEWSLGQKSDHTTNFFYKEVVSKFIECSDGAIRATQLNLFDYRDIVTNGGTGKEVVHLYKMLSPFNLLKIPVRNDSNVLNRAFYDELLHIVGLEERKVGSKRTIARSCQGNRNSGSLIESTITHIRHIGAFNSKPMIEEYGNSVETREFNIALELCLSWINRILFLKLLEAQMLMYNNGDRSFQFLNVGMVGDFSDLSDLFFLVLAVKPENRDSSIQRKFCNVPYLNSSLFECTELEEIFRINLLNNNLEIPVFKHSILKDSDSRRMTGSRKCLAYLFEFLDAYDFGSADNGVSQSEGKTLINASVLGLIFEKINGYRDGSIYTPGYVTMFMSRIAIEKAVIEAFSRKFPKWVLNDLDDLKNHITDRSKESILAMNRIIDNLRICDPAVGSGHFLVSCLNELIAVKSRLGILSDSEGKVLSEFGVEVENDGNYR